LNSSLAPSGDAFQYDPVSRIVSSFCLRLLLCLSLLASNVLSANAFNAPGVAIGSVRIYLNPASGRFNQRDSFAGNISDPQSLHKYLYCGNNPINAIDPSGNDLIEQLATSYITSTLISMATSVVAPYISKAISKLIPKYVWDGILNSTPDAITVSANVALNTYAFTGVGGGDVLYSTKTGNWALYDYYGAGLNLGKSTSASIGGAAGLVFNCPTSSDYTGAFLTISLAYSIIPSQVQQKIEAELPELTRITGNIGVDLSSAILDKSSINVFWSPGGGWLTSRGISFGFGTWQTQNNKSNGSVTYTEYTQLAPTDTAGEPQNVPFR
jgi:RHS repeat-associated protein